MLIEVEVNGKLERLRVNSCKVFLSEYKVERHINVGEDGIIIDLINDDGDVIDTVSYPHDELL